MFGHSLQPSYKPRREILLIQGHMQNLTKKALQVAMEQPAIRIFSGILFQSTLYCCCFVCYFPRKFLYAVETSTWLIFFLKKKKKKKNKRRKKSVGWKVAEHCIFCTHITNFLLKDIGKERSQSKNT